MAKRILIVEDESDIAESVQRAMRRLGYEASAEGDGLAAWRRIQAELPDLVVLDLMLPGIDGLELCRLMKSTAKTRSIYVCILSVKDEEIDVVLGLGLGADDYVTKPFGMRELEARVEAILKRGRLIDHSSEEEVLRRGKIVVNVPRHEALYDGRPVPLTATEFRILRHFAANDGLVFSRDQLLNHAMGENAFVIDRNIDVHVRSIRKKLGPGGACIETIRGVGYRFNSQRTADATSR